MRTAAFVEVVRGGREKAKGTRGLGLPVMEVVRAVVLSGDDDRDAAVEGCGKNVAVVFEEPAV